MTAVLDVSGLRVRRGGRRVACPDFRLAAGESRALRGPSGAGKTSLLLAMAGVLKPEAGDAIISGEAMWRLNEEKRARLRGRAIGYVFASFHLADALTVMDNLQLARACAGLAPDRARALSLLDRLGLSGLAARRADRLSQGQMQRVALARAMMNAPALLLCDEPTAALDDTTARDLIGLLTGLAAGERLSLLIATHDARVMAAMDGVTQVAP